MDTKKCDKISRPNIKNSVMHAYETEASHARSQEFLVTGDNHQLSVDGKLLGPCPVL